MSQIVINTVAVIVEYVLINKSYADMKCCVVSLFIFIHHTTGRKTEKRKKNKQHITQ